jgi:Na+/proline symporter
VSSLTIVSFTVLIAGNLSAVAWVLSVVSGTSYLPALVVTTLVIVTYTIAGGLYSAVWTDFLQVYAALVGFAAAALWLIATRGFDAMVAAGPGHDGGLQYVLNRDNGALVNWAGHDRARPRQHHGARFHGARIRGAGRTRPRSAAATSAAR